MTNENRKASSEILYRLATNLRRLRRARGYTQKRLARRCGLTKNYISNVECETVNIGLKEGNHRKFKMTPEAWAVVARQPRTDERIFPYNAKSVSAAFTRACKILGIKEISVRPDGTLDTAATSPALAS